MCCLYKFPPVELDQQYWMILKLHKEHLQFLDDVIEQSYQALLARYTTKESLYRMLRQTTDKEFHRMMVNPWRCDPKDDQVFWTYMQQSIDHNVQAEKLLKSIIKRYVYEMRSQFSVNQYNLVAKIVYYTFVTLLNSHEISFGKNTYSLSTCKKLSDRFHISGQIDLLKALAKKGTIIIVPNHTSNWDSVVIGFAMRQLGIPPLVWGAGLNLFNNRGFDYLFNQLGVYRVDRRKKMIPYLQTQKNYVRRLLEMGCHTLFYPSGTRNRLGSIDTELKLGLLSTVFETQSYIYKKYKEKAKKLFFVPVVANYHCVLEAESLIQETKESGSQASFFKKLYGVYKNFLCTKNMFLKGSEIFVNIGTPLDVMGNSVDVSGCSYDTSGEKIDLYEQFLNMFSDKMQRYDQYIKALSHRIVESYVTLNQVLSSHLVAFVAYELIRDRGDYSMDCKEVIVDFDAFMLLLSKVYQKLCVLYEAKKIDFTPILLKGNLRDIFIDGLANLGVYHAKPPIVTTKKGDLMVRDMWTLLYYHNRLMGYGLETKM